jgi:hypothetical protein
MFGVVEDEEREEPRDRGDIERVYYLAWARLRAGRIAAFGALLGWIPVAAITHGLGQVPLLHIPWWHISTGLCAAVSLVGGIVTRCVRCPVCSEYFTVATGHNPLTGRCLNCGVRQWSVPNGARPR